MEEAGERAMPDSLSEAFSLEGRVAVITGAASGLGREAALTLAEAGATPVLADVDVPGLEETASLIGKMGVAAQVCPADVAERPQIEALADHAARITGTVDIWVNVAGILVNRPVIDARDDEVERMLGVNLKGAAPPPGE
jgi:3-oxoacyl-[acyl-carrier protein] reductase